MAGKDVAEKLLEAYNDVFADIVNGLLFDGETVVRPEELEDQAPRAIYKADGAIREIERDVAKRWVKGNIRIACVGIENQTDPDPDMPLRVYSYDGAEYRTQLLKENRKKPRYPVVTLVLYFGTDRHWDKPLTLHEALNVPERLRPFVSDVKINLFEIAWLSREQVSRFTSDFRIVADYFVQKRETGNYVPEPEKIRHVQAIMQLLSVMTRDHRFEEVYNESQREGGIENMCQVLDRIEQRGMARGIDIGEKKKSREATLALYEMGLRPEDIARALNEELATVQAWLAEARAR